jgi:LPXTG-site transpeptidase (sortase) family protein
LENGVVKYPTTPAPWEWGNAFFFGHTSQEYWKNNPYGTVFRRIPQLKEGDKIQVIRDWVLYEYKVIDTVIVKPKNVNDTYMNFGEEWKEYITLMWCYPIWRTDKRMMVFAEKI